jgi:hypothetical protein
MVSYTKTLFLTNPYLASLTYYPHALTLRHVYLVCLIHGVLTRETFLVTPTIRYA